MRIGFIGLGTMGAGMALNVMKAGFQLVVNDIRKEAASVHLEKGAEWAADAAGVAAKCDVLLTSLPGPAEVEATAQQVLPVMRSGTVWFDLSTNSPTVIRAIAARFAERGITVFDAPVSGGPAGAKSGKLALWVGGPEDVFEKHKSVLSAIGDEILRIGEVGSGSVAKLVHNCAGYAIQTALAEVFTLGVKAGVDPLALWAAVRQGNLGRIRTFDRLKNQFLPKQFEKPDFALKLAFKDISLATQLGRELDVPMRLSSLAYADMTEALNRGWGGWDSRSPMLLQEERAGVDIKVSKEAIQEVLDRDRQ